MKGLIFVALAQLFWAGELVLVRRFFPTANPIMISAVSSFAGSLIYVPLFLLTRETISLNNLGLLVILGLVSWVIPQIFYIKGIQLSTNAFAVAMTTLSMPLFAIVLSALFLREPLTWKMLLGGAFMIIGFIVISLP